MNTMRSEVLSQQVKAIDVLNARVKELECQLREEGIVPKAIELTPEKQILALERQVMFLNVAHDDIVYQYNEAIAKKRELEIKVATMEMCMGWYSRLRYLWRRRNDNL